MGEKMGNVMGGGQKKTLGVAFKPNNKLTAKRVLPQLICIKNAVTGGCFYLHTAFFKGSFSELSVMLRRSTLHCNAQNVSEGLDSVLLCLPVLLISSSSAQWRLILSQSTEAKRRLLLELALIWISDDQKKALFEDVIERCRVRCESWEMIVAILASYDVETGDSRVREWVGSLSVFTQLITPFKLSKKALEMALHLFRQKDCRVFDCSSQHFTTAEHQLFAALLKKQTAIETMQLSYASLSQSALEAYLSTMEELPVLRKCYLSGNHLSYESMLLVSNFVFSHRSLDALMMSETDVDDPCMKVLSDSLFYSHTVTHLDLSRNRISAVGLGYLSHALCSGARLIELDISENPIKGDVSKFCKGLILNQSLQVINVSKTNMRPSNRMRFLQAVNFHSGRIPLKVRA